MFGNRPGMKRTFGDDPADSWNYGQDSGDAGRKKKRRSRWNTDNDEKIVIPGMPTVIPSTLSESQQRQYVVHLQIEEFSRKMRTGDLGIPANPEQRSPSPEPIYNNEGKRLNTREYRTRKKLEEERHKLIQEAIKLNPDFKPPSDYKPPVIRVNDKVMIPQEEHPDINFVGLLIGPRGNTLKTLEKDTGAKIIIRGKGSVKDGKIGRKDGQPLPGEDEPLHAYVTANNPENVKKAVERIKDIIRQGIEVPEGQNDLRRQQLRELALLNGTLRENDGLVKLRQIAESQTIVTNTIVCAVCGGTGHIAQDCKQRRPGDSFRMQQMQNPAERAKMDSEYMSLMAELGEGPPPLKNEPPPPHHPNFGRPLLANPPPNPMGMNSPWQMNNRPPMGSHGPQHNNPPMSMMNRPHMGMQQHQSTTSLSAPQMNHGMGHMAPMPLMSTSMQPPSGMQPPPGLMPPPQPGQNQPQQHMGGIQHMQSQQGSMLRPWQQQQQQGGGHQEQAAMVMHASQPQMMSSPATSTNGSIGIPPPPPSMLAPPPPPPTSSQQGQPQNNPPWMHQQQLAGKPSGPPPPPPPPPPSTPASSGNSSTSGAPNSVSLHLLNIQSQVLQRQQQNVNTPSQSISHSVMNNQGNFQNFEGNQSNQGNFQNFAPGNVQNFEGNQNAQNVMTMGNQLPGPPSGNQRVSSNQMINSGFQSNMNFSSNSSQGNSQYTGNFQQSQGMGGSNQILERDNSGNMQPLLGSGPRAFSVGNNSRTPIAASHSQSMMGSQGPPRFNNGVVNSSNGPMNQDFQNQRAERPFHRGPEFNMNRNHLDNVPAPYMGLPGQGSNQSNFPVGNRGNAGGDGNINMWSPNTQPSGQLNNQNKR